MKAGLCMAGRVNEEEGGTGSHCLPAGRSSLDSKMTVMFVKVVNVCC